MSATTPHVGVRVFSDLKATLASIDTRDSTVIGMCLPAPAADAAAFPANITPDATMPMRARSRPQLRGDVRRTPDLRRLASRVDMLLSSFVRRRLRAVDRLRRR